MSVYSYIELIIPNIFIPYFSFENVLNDSKIEIFIISLQFDFNINDPYVLINNAKHMPNSNSLRFSLAMQKCYNRVENKNFYKAILKSYDIYKDIIKNYLENPSNKNLNRIFLRTISISDIKDGEIECISNCNFSVIKEFMEFFDLKIILIDSVVFDQSNFNFILNLVNSTKLTKITLKNWR